MTENAAQAVDVGDTPAVAVETIVEAETDTPGIDTERGGHGADQAVPPFARAGRYQQRLRVRRFEPARRLRADQVALVEHEQHRAIRGADLGEHASDRGGARRPVRMTRIDHVQEEIGLGHLLQRGAERRHQGMRQPIDESDRVRNEHGASIRQAERPHQRVEGNEQRVRRRRLAGRQPVEQRALAGVRIADQGDGRGGSLAPPLAQAHAPAAHAVEVARQAVDTLPDAPAIGLELRLTRTAGPDARSETRERRAHSGQARQQVAKLRQLHLQPALPGACAGGENVKNDLRAVDHAAAEFPLQITGLDRAQLPVDHDQVDLELLARRGDLTHLAAADETGRVRPGALLQGPEDDRRAGGVRQALELVEGALGGLTATGAETEADNRRAITRRRVHGHAETCHRVDCTPTERPLSRIFPRQAGATIIRRVFRHSA